MKKNVYLIAAVFMILISRSIAQVNFTSSNLPIVVINTNGQEILNEPKITADMGIIFNGEGLRNNLNDPFNHYNGKIGIEIRGSSSQMFPKKSYGLETRDETGEDANVSLLGMPEEADWILYAPYSDKSLIRNVLIYALSNNMGRYTTRTKFVELILNGEYNGIYVLMEKIKRDKNRVNIKKLEPKDSTGSSLTGGYIVKIDKREGSETLGWDSEFPPFTGAWQKIYYQYHYPKESDIIPQQISFIQNFIYNFESNLFGENYKHPFHGYYDIIDINTFVDYFLLNEFPRNVDAYRLSAFMYKDRDDVNPLLKMGPVWDFNLAFGNVDYYDAWKHEGWQLSIPILDDNFQIPFWWKKLINDPVFSNAVANRWNELKSSLFDKDRIFSIIDSLTANTEEARIRNFQKWNILGTYVWPNYYVGSTYESEINYLKSWITYRLNWLEGFIPSDNASVDWKAPDSVEIFINQLDSAFMPIQEFFNSASNVESFDAFSSNENLTVTKQGDQFIFTSSVVGNYKVKFYASHSANSKSLSPAYNVIVGITDADSPYLPDEFTLSQNHPNPFNPTTKIKFTIPSVVKREPSNVKLIVYDILGREIKTLLNKPMQPGEYQVEFDATGLPSGVYFYRLSSGRFVQTKKMVLIR